MVILNRERHDRDGLVMVTGRDVAEGEYAVTFTDAGAWTLDGRPLAEAAAIAAQRRAVAGVGDRLAEVIAYVNDCPVGVRTADVAKALDMDPKQAGVYLGRAVKSQRLTREAPEASITLLEVLGCWIPNPVRTQHPTPLLKGGANNHDQLAEPLPPWWPPG